jgi:cation:H+ antiporter
MIDVVALLGGIVVLYLGAEWLVSGASRLAGSFGVSPLVVGLTVVAYGTSAPELVVGVGAALGGQGSIALGNVIGSNIANVGLILAVTALIAPPAIERARLRRDAWVLLGSAMLVPLALLDGVVAAWEGVGLVGLAVGYTVITVRTAKPEAITAALDDLGEVAGAAERVAGMPRPVTRAAMVVRAVAGLGLLVLGGHFLVEGAVGLARSLGMSERLIGLTIVAVGTSVPELATSVVAALRGHSDIAVGNVVGSNIFNVLLILGGAGMARPLHASLDVLWFDVAVLGAMTVAATAVVLTQPRVTRPIAAVLGLGYVAFLATLAWST